VSRSSRVITQITCAAFIVFIATEIQAQSQEILGEVRVHGNHTTPDEEILALAGLTLGAPVTDELLRQAAHRLAASGRFAGVDVRKRHRSIDNPSDILVVLLVDERAAISETDLMPGPLKRIRSAGMWLPVLDYADGYGFTYGARVSFVDVLGPRTRLSVPLTWGGERKVAAEVERTFARGPLSRIEGVVSLTRRENPHFDIADRREEVRVRAERALTSWLRAGGGLRTTKVTFGEVEQRHLAPNMDITVDTRIDPAFPRNAIHATTGIEQLRFEDGPQTSRWTTDVRGYVGLYRSAVLAVRAITIQSSDPLPPFEQALLGGTSILRGYRFGYAAGDNLAAASVEIRLPLTSPLNIGRFGVKAFVDSGTVYPSGAKLSGNRFDRGIGGGVFFTATVIRAGLDVAWPESGKPRWHFGLGVTF
jgi:outer membrane protein assembly factor BamA